MAETIPAIERTSLQEQARGILLKQILSGQRPVGSKLEPVRELAQRFGVSTRPVAQALEQLERRGYVERRPRSGIFVMKDEPPPQMSEVVMLCLRPGAHVFGDLCQRLSQRLMHDGLTPMVMDPGSRSEPGARAIRRALASDAQQIVVHGESGFLFKELQSPARGGRPIIGVINWRGGLEMTNVHRVLVDHAAGARQVADWLWGRGHRSVLVTGTEPMLDHTRNRAQWHALMPPPGAVFVPYWQQLGGHVELIGADLHKDRHELQFDQSTLHGVLDGPEAPTAVFGLYDFAIACLKRHLRRTAPERLNDLCLVGYGNTPWAEASDPPFASVDLNLGLVAEQAVDIIERINAGDRPDPGEIRWIEPVLRGGDEDVDAPRDRGMNAGLVGEPEFP